MKTYLDMVDYVLLNGKNKEDRTNTGTISVFGYQNRYDLQKGFPLLTTKKVHFKSVVHELLWFINGDTNIKYLVANGVKIWNEWADKNGDLGPVYGKQWRDFNGVDQLKELIEQIKTNPSSRRLILNAWNASDIDKMALAPCHCLVQFYVNDDKLSCQLYQRSADLFLGVPFNIASYSLLTHMIAHVCDLEVGEFIHSFGDLHIYNNHIEQLELQKSRNPLNLCHLKLNKEIKDIFDFKYEDISLENYQSHPPIKGMVSV